MFQKVKGGLREIGQLKNYSFRAPKMRDIPPQRLSFMIELIKAAGYKGWVVLLDEIGVGGSVFPTPAGPILRRTITVDGTIG